MTNHDELLARLDWLGKNNNLLWEEQSWCINAAAAIRSLKAQLEAKEEERKLHERAAHDSDIRCQAAVRSEKTEHRVREEAERKMMNDIQPCCQEWHTCTKRCAPLAENWRMAAKAAEQRLAQIEAENKQLREALAPNRDGFRRISAFPLQPHRNRVQGEKMKPLKAYAIMDSDGKLACFNHQVPIYWMRKIALEECKANCFADSKVITVTVSDLVAAASQDEAKK